MLARKEVPALRIVRVPGALSVGADYGLVVRSDASGEAWRLALYPLASRTKTLSDYGFEAASDAGVTRPGADDRTGFPLLRIGPAESAGIQLRCQRRACRLARGPGVCRAEHRTVLSAGAQN